MVDYSKWDNLADSSDEEGFTILSPDNAVAAATAAATSTVEDRGECDGCGKPATIGPCRLCRKSYCSTECEFGNGPFDSDECVVCPGIIEVQSNPSRLKGRVRHHAEKFWNDCDDVSSPEALDAAQRQREWRRSCVDKALAKTHAKTTASGSISQADEIGAELKRQRAELGSRFAIDDFC